MECDGQSGDRCCGIYAKVPALFLLASASAMSFWVIEAIWKSFHQAYYPRIRVIQAFMRGVGTDEFSPPDISHSWTAAWRRNSFVSILCWSHVCLPHVAIVVAGLLLWVLNPSHSIVSK